MPAERLHEAGTHAEYWPASQNTMLTGSNTDNAMVVDVATASAAQCLNCASRAAIAISRHPSALMALTRARRMMQHGEQPFGFGVDQEEMVAATVFTMGAGVSVGFAIIEATAIGVRLQRLRLRETR